MCIRDRINTGIGLLLKFDHLRYFIIESVSRNLWKLSHSENGNTRVSRVELFFDIIGNDKTSALMYILCGVIEKENLKWYQRWLSDYWWIMLCWWNVNLYKKICWNMKSFSCDFFDKLFVCLSILIEWDFHWWDFHAMFCFINAYFLMKLLTGSVTVFWYKYFFQS